MITLATILIGLAGGAVLALVYIIGFDALIEGIRGPAMPWAVMAAAAGLALLVVIWGVARVAALR
jgi:hypothetical protein